MFVFMTSQVPYTQWLQQTSRKRQSQSPPRSPAVDVDGRKEKDAEQEAASGTGSKDEKSARQEDGAASGGPDKDNSAANKDIDATDPPTPPVLDDVVLEDAEARKSEVATLPPEVEKEPPGVKKDEANDEKPADGEDPAAEKEEELPTPENESIAPADNSKPEDGDSPGPTQEEDAENPKQADAEDDTGAAREDAAGANAQEEEQEPPTASEEKANGKKESGEVGDESVLEKQELTLEDEELCPSPTMERRHSISQPEEKGVDQGTQVEPVVPSARLRNNLIMSNSPEHHPNPNKTGKSSPSASSPSRDVMKEPSAQEVVPIRRKQDNPASGDNQHRGANAAQGGNKSEKSPRGGTQTRFSDPSILDSQGLARLNIFRRNDWLEERRGASPSAETEVHDDKSPPAGAPGGRKMASASTGASPFGGHPRGGLPNFPGGSSYDAPLFPVSGQYPQASLGDLSTAAPSPSGDQLAQLRTCERFFRSIEVVENTTVYTEAISVEEDTSEARLEEFVRRRKIATGVAQQRLHGILAAWNDLCDQGQGMEDGLNQEEHASEAAPAVAFAEHGGYGDAEHNRWREPELKWRDEIEESFGSPKSMKSPSSNFMRNLVPSSRTVARLGAQNAEAALLGQQAAFAAVPRNVFSISSVGGGLGFNNNADGSPSPHAQFHIAAPGARSHFDDSFANTVGACGVRLAKHQIHWRAASEYIVACGRGGGQRQVGGSSSSTSLPLAQQQMGGGGFSVSHVDFEHSKHVLGANIDPASYCRSSTSRDRYNGGGEMMNSGGGLMNSTLHLTAPALPPARGGPETTTGVDPLFGGGSSGNNLQVLLFCVPPRLFASLHPGDLEEGFGSSSYTQALRVICEKCPELIFRAFGGGPGRNMDSIAGADGPYVLHLFHPSKGFAREEIAVNDLIPCIEGAPLCGVNRGGELWSYLLEKAVAKMLGGYDKLNGMGILKTFFY